MDRPLKGVRVAILATDGFEQSELMEPKRALESAGADVSVVSPQEGQIHGWSHTDWGQKVKVDRTLDEARADEFDALVLPGGVMNPDRLRLDRRAVQFVRSLWDAGPGPAALYCGA